MLSRFPVALGLTLCEDVVTEAASHDISLIRSFTGLPVERFPSVARPLCVFSALTDGLGQAEAVLSVGLFLDTYQEVYRVRTILDFPDPLRTVYYVMRLSHCPLPRSGVYLFTLALDGTWLAQRSLRVYPWGTAP